MRSTGTSKHSQTLLTAASNCTNFKIRRPTEWASIFLFIHSRPGYPVVSPRVAIMSVYNPCKYKMHILQCHLNISLWVAIWHIGNASVSINKVNLRWAWLVLGWVTVSGFNSQGWHFISVCNQPPRSTQPSTLCGTVKWVPAKGRWWLLCGWEVKACMAYYAIVFKGALQISRFTLLSVLY